MLRLDPTSRLDHTATQPAAAAAVQDPALASYEMYINERQGYATIYTGDPHTLCTVPHTPQCYYLYCHKRNSPTLPHLILPSNTPTPTNHHPHPYTRYRLQRPAAWENISKAGADALFRDPADKATSVGVTVAPTRLTSLPQFGSVEEVGEKLLVAERAKVGMA